MGRAKASSQGLTVPAILNEAQRCSASGHLRYAKMLWEIAEEDTQGTFDAVMFGLKLFMTVPEVGSLLNEQTFYPCFINTMPHIELEWFLLAENCLPRSVITFPWHLCK